MIQFAAYLGRKRSKLAPSEDSVVVNKKQKQEKGRYFDINNIVERMEQTFKLDTLVRRNVDN